MATSEFNLAADASSSSAARRHIRDALDGQPEEIRDAAALLTSELVTNALLHSTGPLTLTVRQEDLIVRVEVADAGSSPPSVKPYGPESATGRGLRMLGALAESWGWQPSDSGKVVWFELSKDGLSATGESRGMQRPTDPISVDPYPRGVPIVLLRAPVQPMIRTGACYDAMYRELRQIISGDLSANHDPPARLIRLMDEVNTQFLGFGRDAEDVWERAIREGLRHVDITFRLPRQAGDIVEQYGKFLDQAEDYCKQWRPRVAPPEEVSAVRRWAFREVAAQCRGEEAMPWGG